MADFTVQGRHPAIFRVTDDVTGPHNITNDTPAPLIAGTIVGVSRGNHTIQHLDGDTLVEIAPGATVAVDPSGVTGAVGVGFNDNNEQASATVYNYVV